MKVLPIYSEDYYKAQKLTKDLRFLEGVRGIKSHCEQLGCPIPRQGFGTYDLYLKWNKNYWDAYAKIESSNSRKKDMIKPFGYQIDDILEECGIGKKNKKFYDFIEQYIFFGKTELSETMFDILWTKSPKTNELELHLRVYPHTTKNQIAHYWDKIAAEQKLLQGYKGKNKRWEMFDRDISIYGIYQKEKSKSTRKRAPNGKSLDEKVYGVVLKKYPRITMADIRKAIAKVRKLEG